MQTNDKRVKYSASNDTVTKIKSVKQITDTSNMGVRYICEPTVKSEIYRNKAVKEIKYPELDLRSTPNGGKILIATTTIQKNTVFPYGGEGPISIDEKKTREDSGKGEYFVEINGNWYDGHPDRAQVKGLFGNVWPGTMCNQASGFEKYNCFIDSSFKWNKSVPLGCESVNLFVIRTVRTIRPGEPFLLWYGFNNKGSFKFAKRRGYCPAVPDKE